ncbi:MAG: hypothetical protein MI757_14990, partial [Pirellulales bacterium]|nr:hypothetical protein [Pirellulales bacterium]
MTEHESQRPGNDEKIDELRDRLVDRALAEVLGDDSPPDLSAQILAAVEREQSSSLLETQERESIMSKPEMSASWGRYVSVACVFALLGGGVTWITMQSSREAAPVAKNEANDAALDAAKQKGDRGDFSYAGETSGESQTKVSVDGRRSDDNKSTTPRATGTQPSGRTTGEGSGSGAGAGGGKASGIVDGKKANDIGGYVKADPGKVGPPVTKPKPSADPEPAAPVEKATEFDKKPRAPRDPVELPAKLPANK